MEWEYEIHEASAEYWKPSRCYPESCTVIKNVKRMQKAWCRVKLCYFNPISYGGICRVTLSVERWFFLGHLHDKVASFERGLDLSLVAEGRGRDGHRFLTRWIKTGDTG